MLEVMASYVKEEPVDRFGRDKHQKIWCNKSRTRFKRGFRSNYCYRKTVKIYARNRWTICKQEVTV